MLKKIIIATLSIALTIIAVEIILRISGHKPAHFDETTNVLIVKPDSFLVKDPATGWRLGAGCYSTYMNTTLMFNHCVDNKYNRETPHFTALDPLGAQIHLYGCSYTFGYSVSDSSTMAYHLQQLDSNIIVVNKGVPGYALVQMYLQLKKEVEAGNKPQIAVFNYAAFHNARTPLNHQWIRAFKYAAIQSGAADGSLKIDYPYAVANEKDGKLEVKTMLWKDLPQDYPLRDKSCLVDLINTTSDNWQYSKQKPVYEELAYKMALEVNNYCKQNHIHLLFTGIDDESQKLLKRLQQEKIDVLYYDVNISDSNLNCSPIDPSHPNSKAHNIYAHKLYQYFKSKNWVGSASSSDKLLSNR